MRPYGTYPWDRWLDSTRTSIAGTPPTDAALDVRTFLKKWRTRLALNPASTEVFVTSFVDWTVGAAPSLGRFASLSALSNSAMNRCPPGTRPSVTDWWAETRAEAAKSDTSILRATLPSASRVNFGEAARGWLRWAYSWDGLRPRPPTSLTGRRTCACSRPGEEGDRFGHLATRSASARDTAAVSCAHGSSAVSATNADVPKSPADYSPPAMPRVPPRPPGAPGTRAGTFI